MSTETIAFQGKEKDFGTNAMQIRTVQITSGNDNVSALIQFILWCLGANCYKIERFLY